MAKAAAHFDAQTIAFMKVALDEAWDRLPPKLQATMLKTTLAERILKSAAIVSACVKQRWGTLPRSGNKEGLASLPPAEWAFDNVPFRDCRGRCPLWVKSRHWGRRD